VDTSATRKVVDEVRRGTQERLNQLALDLQSGKLTNTAEFAIEMRDSLRDLYTTTHILARGGLDQMEQKDWGMLGQSLKEQYSYVNSMVRDIENGNIGVKDSNGEVIIRDSGIPELSDGFLNRVDLYTESAWGARGEYENVVRDREMELGSLERRVLDPSVVKHCDECIELSERGFQPPGLMPDIGDCECGPGDACEWEFENQELDDLAQAFGHPEIGVEGTEPTDQPEFTLYPDEGKSLKGGPGSGNFGHSGIPGQVGGSSTGGGGEIPKGQWEKVNTADEALAALAAGRYVQLEPNQVGVVMDKMAAMARDAEAKGKDAPKFNLCNISVANTNVFCGGGEASRPRIEMPRIPNSDRKNFRDYLRENGVKVKKDDVRVDRLKASQKEIDGTKVSEMMSQVRSGERDLSNARIFVSKDNFIIDGHHKWAATVGLDYGNKQLGDMKMKVYRVDLPITALFKVANDYTDLKGHQRLAGGQSSYKKAIEFMRAWYKGGPGSGNFGHEGRPGMVGGSGGGSGDSSEPMLSTIHGSAPTAIIRYMANPAQGYSKDQIRSVLSHYGVEINQNTLNTQYYHGRSGKQGAMLTQGGERRDSSSSQ
jgi:hypothetical protein